MDAFQTATLDLLQDNTIQLAFLLGGILLLATFAKAQPSRRAFILLLAPIPLIVLSPLWPWLTALTAIYTPVLMLVLMVDAFLLSAPASGFQLSRSMNRKFSIGQENAIALTLISNTAHPVSGTLRDESPAAMPCIVSMPQGRELPVTATLFGRETVTYSLRPARRGQYRFGRIRFRYRSRLKLLWLHAWGGRGEDVNVVPDLQRIRRMRILASRSLHRGELQRRALGQEGTQFSGLRPYFTGDDIKKIAWQATAKLEHPIVRTYEPEVEQPILILLDAGRKMATYTRHLSKYDWALNAALAFAATAIDRRDCVGAGVFSNRILLQTSMGSGRHHFNRMIEQLSETMVQAVEPDYEGVMLQFSRTLKRRSLIVMFTDLIDPMASRHLLHSLQGLSDRHLLMVVTLADSETETLADHMPETADEAYRQGVALDLLSLRKQTMLELKRRNHATLIDAPPDRLDEAVIERYLAIKRKGYI